MVLLLILEVSIYLSLILFVNFPILIVSNIISLIKRYSGGSEFKKVDRAAGTQPARE